MELTADQAVDISGGKATIIDKPVEGPKATDPPAGDPPKTNPPKEEPKGEVKKEETPPAKEEPQKEETAGVVLDNKPKEEPKKEEPPAKEEVKTPDFNAYLKEKFEIDSEADLEKILQYNQTVKEELEAEKKKEPVYKSDKEKKIAEFLKGYDLDRLGEGVESAATLMGMDIEKIDERRALEEAYVLKNTDLTREEAKKLYAKEYRKRYEVKEETEYDDKKEWEEDKELSVIQRKKDVAEARRFLAAKKEELKFKEPEKKEEPKKEEPIEISKETIGGYSSQLSKVFEDKKWDGITYADEKDATLKAKVQFTKEELKRIKEESVNYLRFQGLYDANKKIPNFDATSHIETVARALFGPKMEQQAFREGLTLGKSLKVEQLAGIKPDKESKGQGEQGIPSVLDQFQKLAEEKKKKLQR